MSGVRWTESTVLSTVVRAQSERVREGTFLIGGGGPGLRRGVSFVNILQIWEGQTRFKVGTHDATSPRDQSHRVNCFKI